MVPTTPAFTAGPGGATTVSPLNLQPVVTVEDSLGNTVAVDASAVTVALTTPDGAALTCAANPLTYGRQRRWGGFAGCTVNPAGSYTLTATDGLVPSAISASFTIGG